MRHSDISLKKLLGISFCPVPAAVIAGLAIILLTHLSGGAMFVILKNAYIHEIHNNLRNTAIVLAAEVDVEAHKRLKKGEEGSELYKKLNRPLETVLANSDGSFAYAYTLKRSGDSLFFVLDGAKPGDSDNDGIDDKSYIDEYYESSTPQMLTPFETGKPYLESKPYCDKWGCFISAFIPIFDNTGKVVAVQGVDMSIDEYNQKIKMVALIGSILSVISCFLGVFIGISVYLLLRSMRRMIEESDRQNRLKGEFLAVMSHEIRTPLNGIIGISHHIDDHIIDTEGHSLLKTLQESGMGLLEIINDILDFSKIEAGKMSLDLQPISIREIIRDIERILSTDLQKKSIRFSWSVSDDIPMNIVADGLRVRQILLNLVGNAVKFTPENGRVSIECVQSDNQLKCSVSDSGIGIPEDKIGHLFQPFVQADQGTARNYGGTGLGLMISRNLVHLMGGTITCHSKVGNGTTFVWEIPLVESESEAVVHNPVPVHSPLEWEGKRVLVVDDYEVNLKVAELMLKRLGIEVDTCTSGFDALELVEENQYDLLFMDIRMPEMDGPTTVAMIKKSNPHFSVPVAALTANVMKDDQLSYIASGIPYFLSKPIIQKDLLELLARVFSGNDQNRHNA